MGRPTKYRAEYATNDYLDGYIAACEIAKKLISLCGFSCYIGVCEDTLQEWRKVHPGFSVLLAKLKQMSKDMLLNKGLDNTYNSTIAKLILSSNHGMAEKSETVHGITEKTATLMGLIDGNSKGMLPEPEEEDV